MKNLNISKKIPKIFCVLNFVQCVSNDCKWDLRIYAARNRKKSRGDNLFLITFHKRQTRKATKLHAPKEVISII